MKKFVTLLLAFVMTVPMWSLAACSNDNRAEQLKMYVPGESTAKFSTHSRIGIKNRPVKR